MSQSLKLYAEVKPYGEWQYFGEFDIWDNYLVSIGAFDFWDVYQQIRDASLTGLPENASLILKHIAAFDGCGTYCLTDAEILKNAIGEECWDSLFTYAKWPIRFIFWLS